MRRSGTLWLGGIVAGAVAWTFTGVDLAAHHGTLDALDAALVAIGGLFVAIPRIDRLRASIPIFGRTGVALSVNELQSVAADASQLALHASETAEEAAALYERWLVELGALLGATEPSDPDERTQRLLRFVNTRLEDISTWVGRAGEDVRATLWWWSDADGGAIAVAAPRIADRETLEHVFVPGEGILGRVLLDGERIDLADAPAEAGWARIAADPPRYHGLLCVPIVVRGRVAGVLTVDRTAAETF